MNIPGEDGNSTGRDHHFLVGHLNSEEDEVQAVCIQ